ncbi:MAG: DUF3160 domain-containing protein [Synergistetes bacterium]|nr:DUF3160 domain-containing protein [Synergistota bacterium]MDW8192616.1 DUF3160 domain-containing protein [Synergistota bacterium]
MRLKIFLFLVLGFCSLLSGPSLSYVKIEDVSNIDRFHIPDSSKALLEKNLFVVCPASHWQPFFVYEDNVYRRIPNFVTVDSVLHLYHLFFNFTLRKLEEERFLPLLKTFTRGLLSQTIRTYDSLQGGELKEAALRNVAYVGVAFNLLGLKGELPPQAQSMVSRELNLIRERPGLVEGNIFPYAIDYTQFIPRGHYAGKESLRRYFMVMAWYGLVPFSPAYRDSEGNLKLSSRVALQTMLIVNDVYSAGLVDTWDRLFKPLNYFVGFSDDLTVREVRGLLESVYGKRYNLSDLSNPSALRLYIDKFIKLRQPRIKPKLAHLAGRLPNLPDPEASQFRLMGQRYTPDSEVLQELSDPKERPIPCGLDLIAVMGSDRAYQIIDGGYRVYGLPEAFGKLVWKEYINRRDELAQRFSQLREGDWTSTLYWGWLWVLKSLIEPVDERCPPFMKNVAWKDKSIQTALASWVQLRHDIVLYAKQSFVGAEGGDGSEEVVKGYVEPNVEAWKRLLTLIRQTKKLFNYQRLFVKGVDEKLNRLENMIDFLLKCAEKELKGEPLSEQDYIRIETIGGEMDFLALEVVSDGKASGWMELVHPSDRNMACVVDVHTADIRVEGFGHQVLEEAIGHANEIFVIVPIEGKPTLTRGAVFSYYEFLWPASDRLTDERWQEMLSRNIAPPQPSWTGSFTSPEKIKVKETPAP